MGNTINPTSSAAQTVQADLKKVQDDATWVNQNKGTASKEDIAAHTQTAEKDWEKFTGDNAGLQQSSDPNDKQFAQQSYSDAATAFSSTQSDLKEVLGGRLNGDLQSGDATAKNVQQNLSSLIDQGNAAAVHSQSLLNATGQSGNNPPAAPTAGGTASPNAVQSQLPVTAKSDAAKTVQTDLGKIQDDAKWISQNKNTASKEDIAAHTQTAEKDWEKFTNDNAGLQQSSDHNDRQFAYQSSGAAAAAFNSTQSDLKEVLGGRLNADLQSGDPTAKNIQQNLSSLIDQGNALLLHFQSQQNSSGAAAAANLRSAAPGSPEAAQAQRDVANAASVYVTGPGTPAGAGPVAGGTASPNYVSTQSVNNFNHDYNGLQVGTRGGPEKYADIIPS